jgi:hypothetical protein
LDKITERAQLDDEDLASMRRGWGIDVARARSCQRVQIDKPRELLEGFEYRCMSVQLDRAETR